MDNRPRIVIFANGLVPDPGRLRSLLRPDDRIICADGGTQLALRLGLIPEAVVGDLDSIVDADRARIEQAHVPIEKYPIDKDQTDLELALGHALEKGPGAILIVGALGGRLDHSLGNISLLADPRLEGIDCRMDDGDEEVILCGTRVEVRGTPGDIVSLIPWGRPALGVRTEGLRWKLNGDTLFPDKSRGISNQMTTEHSLIQIDAGLLLVVHSRRSQPVPPSSPSYPNERPV